MDFEGGDEGRGRREFGFFGEVGIGIGVGVGVGVVVTVEVVVVGGHGVGLGFGGGVVWLLPVNEEKEMGKGQK